MSKKQVQLCFLETACTGGYMGSGQWRFVILNLLNVIKLKILRRSTDNGKSKDTLKYYTVCFLVEIQRRY